VQHRLNTRARIVRCIFQCFYLLFRAGTSDQCQQTRITFLTSLSKVATQQPTSSLELHEDCNHSPISIRRNKRENETNVTVQALKKNTTSNPKNKAKAKATSVELSLSKAHARAEQIRTFDASTDEEEEETILTIADQHRKEVPKSKPTIGNKRKERDEMEQSATNASSFPSTLIFQMSSLAIILCAESSNETDRRAIGGSSSTSKPLTKKTKQAASVASLSREVEFLRDQLNTIQRETIGSFHSRLHVRNTIRLRLWKATDD
jgi:hypothetical protein